MNSTSLYIEIGQSSLKALHEDAGLELPIERLENGRLTDSCKERLGAGLRTFLKRQAWQPRLRALCAVNARGVSLRRLSVPLAPKEELQKLLSLQIEAEFPLPPDELAWGYRQLAGKDLSHSANPNRQDVIVVAVKKEVLEEYSELLAKCGVNTEFTLAALARSLVCPQPTGSYAVLDIGRRHAELVAFENGAPTAVRILSWGGEDLTESIQQHLAVSHDEAEKLKINSSKEPAAIGEQGQAVPAAMAAAFDSLAAMVRGHWTGQKLYLTGRTARLSWSAACLAKVLEGVNCEGMELIPGEGRSAATLGLKKSDEKENGTSLVMLQLKEVKGRVTLTEPGLRKWAAIAGLLLLGVVLFPYAEAMLMKRHLTRKLAEIQASKGRLATIDREFHFLEDLKTNQAPYLDAMYLIADASPQGTRIESLSMNGRGEVSLRGNLQNSQQVTQFRSKLIDSGFFSTVVVEEQAPSPDHQKLTVRMSAQWKPRGAREALKLGPTAEEMEKIKASTKELQSMGPPMMGGPMMGAPFPMGGGGGSPPPPQMGAPSSSTNSGPPGPRRLPRRLPPNGAPLPLPPGSAPGPQ